jgi:hypothetical protein
MAAHADLWGELTPNAIRTPVTVLREQASLLGSKTRNMIEGKVETWASGTKFLHSFNLVVPALDNYSYELFQISHEVELYPVKVEYRSSYRELRTEEEFVDWLRERLSSPETKRIIGNLLAQANS